MSLVSAGYFLGNTPFAREHFSLIVYAIILVSIMPIVVEVIRGLWKQKKS
jgi:membrane-associated protein